VSYAPIYFAPHLQRLIIITRLSKKVNSFFLVFSRRKFTPL